MDEPKTTRNTVTVTVSGAVGCGKSAIAGEIEIAMKALGLPVRWADQVAAQSEKNMTHADWSDALDLYRPEVVIVDGQFCGEVGRKPGLVCIGTVNKMNESDRVGSHVKFCLTYNDGEQHVFIISRAAAEVLSAEIMGVVQHGR